MRTECQNSGFETHRVMEDGDLNEKSNDNFKAENHRHLDKDVISLICPRKVLETETYLFNDFEDNQMSNLAFLAVQDSSIGDIVTE